MPASKFCMSVFCGTSCFCNLSVKNLLNRNKRLSEAFVEVLVE